MASEMVISGSFSDLVIELRGIEATRFAARHVLTSTWLGWNLDKPPDGLG